MGRARDEQFEDEDQPRRRRRDEDDDVPARRRPADDEDDGPRRRRREEEDAPRKKKKGKGLLIALIGGGVGLVVLILLFFLLFSGGGLQSRLAGKWKTERKLGGGGNFKRVETTTWEFQSGKYSRETLLVEEGEFPTFVDGKQKMEKETREFRITMSGEFKVGTHKLFGDMISLQPLKKDTERKKNGKKEEPPEKDKKQPKDDDEELRAEIYAVIIIGDTLAFQPMGMGRDGTLKRVK